MGNRGDAMAVRFPELLEKKDPHISVMGAGPRPWSNCWTYEPRIKIIPPVWCWDMQDDTMFGLDFKPKRNGNRRKVKLNMVQIHEGRPVYCITVEMPDGNEWQYLDSIPVLDPYFAPIWPETCREATEAEAPEPEPVADPVAETVTNALEPERTSPEAERTGPEAERTPENTEQTTDSKNSATVAILPINGYYYYYVWFEEPPTEGETYEQKAGP